jgi:hypothetical protein
MPQRAALPPRGPRSAWMRGCTDRHPTIAWANRGGGSKEAPARAGSPPR